MRDSKSSEQRKAEVLLVNELSTCLYSQLYLHFTIYMFLPLFSPFFPPFSPFLPLSPFSSLPLSLLYLDTTSPFIVTWGESLIAKSEEASVSSTLETFWMGTVNMDAYIYIYIYVDK